MLECLNPLVYELAIEQKWVKFWSSLGKVRMEPKNSLFPHIQAPWSAGYPEYPFPRSSFNTKRTSTRFHSYALVSALLRRPSFHLYHMVSTSLSRPMLFSRRDCKAIQSIQTSWYPSSYNQTGDEHNWTQSVVRCIRFRRFSWCVSFFYFWIWSLSLRGWKYWYFGIS